MSEREKLRDDIAMAICMASCGMAAHRSDYMADADAALAALEAAGVRLVPVEATEEMVSAYYDEMPTPYHIDMRDTGEARQAIEHVLSASPFAKETGNG
jgi:hypothetical protein